MSSSVGKFLPLLTVLLVSAACRPTSEGPTPGYGGELPIERIDIEDAIPADWGPLISVMATTGRVYLLWFQDGVGTIRIVYFDELTGRVMNRARVIPRD